MGLLSPSRHIRTLSALPDTQTTRRAQRDAVETRREVLDEQLNEKHRREREEAVAEILAERRRR